jgi:hypothetical protein
LIFSFAEEGGCYDQTSFSSTFFSQPGSSFIQCSQQKAGCTVERASSFNTECYYRSTDDCLAGAAPTYCNAVAGPCPLAIADVEGQTCVGATSQHCLDQPLRTCGYNADIYADNDCKSNIIQQVHFSSGCYLIGFYYYLIDADQCMTYGCFDSQCQNCITSFSSSSLNPQGCYNGVNIYCNSSTPYCSLSGASSLVLHLLALLF